VGALGLAGLEAVDAMRRSSRARSI